MIRTHHRDTENTEGAQRVQINLGHYSSGDACSSMDSSRPFPATFSERGANLSRAVKTL